MPPSSILIVGSGVFGLSTAHALAQRDSYPQTTITVLDRSPFPSPDGSSIDSSRIIRADYSDPAYAALAFEAQEAWRGELGQQGRYSESGLLLSANRGVQGQYYVQSSLENVKKLSEGDDGAVQELPDKQSIERVSGTGGSSGDFGYVNRRSGWADAEAGMRWLREQVEKTGRVSFKQGEVTKLLISETKDTTNNNSKQRTITGVQLADTSQLHADLVILATGAWTGKLIDLRGRATATGQVLMYMDITAAEQEQLANMPVLLNMSTGCFVIPPRNGVLKVARHGYGYSNPQTIDHPTGGAAAASEEEEEEEKKKKKKIEVSVPYTTFDDPGLQVPAEGVAACRAELAEMVPSLADRPFARGRICWYTDTPEGNFLISYHPDFEGLFVASGGCGHGYKFLPVIGRCIVDCVEGKCPEAFREKWAWPKETVKEVVTEDGSRGGRPGMMLKDEMTKER